MAISPVRFIEGRNHNLFSQTYEDPSGFRGVGMQGDFLNRLLQIAQEEYKRVMETAPSELHDLVHLDPEIELYAMSKREPEEAGALTRYANVRIELTEGGGDQRIPRFPLTGPEGIGVKCSPSTFSSTKELSILRRHVGHELIHVITAHGENPYRRSTKEALTKAIERQIYGPEEEGLENADRYGWHLDSMQFTDGLAEPDFASNTYHSPRTIDPIYVAGTTALRSISAEAIWKIWIILINKSHEMQCYPLLQDVRNAILEVLQERGEKIVRSPAFMEMTREGPHIIAFQSQDKRRALIFSTSRKRNPNFGEQADGSWDYDCFHVYPHDKRIPYKQLLYDRKGRPMRDVDAKGTLGSSEHWDHNKARERLEKIGGAAVRQILSRLGKRITYTIKGLSRPIEIYKDGEPTGTVGTVRKKKKKNNNNNNNNNKKKRHR